MAKIDCSVTVNFAREYSRMCKRMECNECPANPANNDTDYDCERLLYSYPEVAIEIVQKWSDEHPQKTRLDDLLEKHSGVVVESNGCPTFYPVALGYCNNCDLCKWADGDTHKHCWHEPVDGGATGKAVE